MVVGKNRGGRNERREDISPRSSRTLRCFLVAALWPAAVMAQPTFSKDVGPIIWNHCTSCHRPGEIGPFSLITYDDVRRHATQIADVTARRIMPPWKPAAGKGDFQGARRLSDPELQSLQQWLANGAPEGDATLLAPAPEWGDGWQMGRPDLIVTMPDEFTVPADGADVFRTFVLPIPIAGLRYVRAIE